MIRDPNWSATHPRWRAWHSALLYASALGLTILGAASIWGGFLMVSDRFSPRLVVGLPFIILGVGLFLRIEILVWLVSGLCIVFSGLVYSGQFRQFAYFSTPVEPWGLLMASGSLAYAVLMITGMLRGSHSDDSVAAVGAKSAEAPH